MRDKANEQIIYLVSGPLGVGKSTTTKELAQKVKRCVLIEGDDLLHMYKGELQPTWEERLDLTWKNILALTRNFIQHDLNVVIDFVVEEELEWFCNQLSDLNVTLKYVVLRADKEVLMERLHTRGDNTHSVQRSMFLLDKLEGYPSNSQFLLDTTLKHPAKIAEEIINDSSFYI